MEARVNLVAVGVFVIVLTLAAIGSVLYLSSSRYYQKSYDTYQTYMTESVAGLNRNAPVRYRGVDVGRVRAIALAPDNVELVEVTLEIERGTPVKVDTVAVLETQGLTGIAFVDLTAGHRESPPLVAKPGEAYPVIQSGTSLMGRLETSVPVLLAGLTRASDNFSAVLDEDNQRALKRILADLGQLSRTLAARSATIDAGLAEAARAAKNATRFTEQLPQLVQRVERSADAFDRMASELGGAGTSASRAVDATRADLQQFTAEPLPEMRELVVELRELTATLQRAADRVERNPGALLQGQPAPKRGPGE
jgi:phospholipid/cholesterol/gamma-HCH transport system substrate-binding protein